MESAFCSVWKAHSVLHMRTSAKSEVSNQDDHNSKTSLFTGDVYSVARRRERLQLRIIHGYRYRERKTSRIYNGSFCYVSVHVGKFQATSLSHRKVQRLTFTYRTSTSSNFSLRENSNCLCLWDTISSVQFDDPSASKLSSRIIKEGTTIGVAPNWTRVFKSQVDSCRLNKMSPPSLSTNSLQT